MSVVIRSRRMPVLASAARRIIELSPVQPGQGDFDVRADGCSCIVTNTFEVPAGAIARVRWLAADSRAHALWVEREFDRIERELSILHERVRYRRPALVAATSS